jgi:hypothetical protein
VRHFCVRGWVAAGSEQAIVAAGPDDTTTAHLDAFEHRLVALASQLEADRSMLGGLHDQGEAQRRVKAVEPFSDRFTRHRPRRNGPAGCSRLGERPEDIRGRGQAARSCEIVVTCAKHGEVFSQVAS